MMRLDGITGIEEGNIYLEKFRERYNKKFAKLPRDASDAHRALPEGVNLAKILCVKEKRKLSKQLAVQFDNRCYQVKPKGAEARRLIGAGVLVFRTSGGVIIEKDGLEYNYTIYDESPTVTPIMDQKVLTAFLDKKRPMSVIERQRKKIAINF